jgi:tRNA (adenine22-N1)-methyltransferase
LAELGLGLEQEVLLYDRGQFYELLNVSAQARQPIPLVGDTMWQLNLATHRKYLQQRIRYQSRIAKAGSQLQQQALQAYLALQQKIAGRL